MCRLYHLLSTSRQSEITDFQGPPQMYFWLKPQFFMIRQKTMTICFGSVFGPPDFTIDNISIKVSLNSDQSKLTPFSQMTSENLSNKLLQWFPPPIRALTNCTRPVVLDQFVGLGLIILTNHQTCQLDLLDWQTAVSTGFYLCWYSS